MRLHVGVLLALLQAVSTAASVRSGCSPQDQELAVVRANDSVEVMFALAGGEHTCYKVTLSRDGDRIPGYTVDTELPAITAYVRERQLLAEASFEAQARQALAALVPPPKPTAGNKNPPAVTEDLGVFENFSGRDAKGKTVSLSGIGGRVVLVTFWSPKNGTSKQRLMSFLPLYNQFKRSGLSAIGISMDSNTSHLLEALDDVTLGWPQVVDRSGLAKRYAVDPRVGKTFVLDASHHIVAVGLSGSDLGAKVRELLSVQ